MNQTSNVYKQFTEEKKLFENLQGHDYQWTMMTILALKTAVAVMLEEADRQSGTKESDIMVSMATQLDIMANVFAERL